MAAQLLLRIADPLRLHRAGGEQQARRLQRAERDNQPRRPQLEAAAAGSDQDDALWPLVELQRDGDAGRTGAQDGEFARQFRAVLNLVRVMKHEAEQT